MEFCVESCSYDTYIKRKHNLLYPMNKRVYGFLHKTIVCKTNLIVASCALPRLHVKRLCHEVALFLCYVDLGSNFDHRINVIAGQTRACYVTVLSPTDSLATWWGRMCALSCCHNNPATWTGHRANKRPGTDHVNICSTKQRLESMYVIDIQDYCC